MSQKTTVEIAIEKLLGTLPDEAQRAAFAEVFKALHDGNKSAVQGGKRTPVGAKGEETEGNVNAGDTVPDGDCDDMAKSGAEAVMLGLYDAVEAINKSALAADKKDEALQDAFQKAFDDVASLLTETSQLSFVAGIAKAKDGKDGKADGQDGQDGDNDEDDMEKAMKGPAGELLRKTLETVTQLSTEIAKLKEAAAAETFAKAASDAGETAEFAKLLKSIAATNPELATTVASVMKGKNAALRAAGVFSEVGKSTGGAAGGAGDAHSKLSVLANEMVTKSVTDGKPITFAKAYTIVAAANPTLYAEHKRGN